PRALEIDVEHRVPLGLGQLVRAAVGADPGVVEQHVDAAEPLGCLGDGGGDRGIVAHVGRERRSLDAERAHLRFERAQLVARAHAVAGVGERLRDVERGDVRASPRERERRGAALAVRGARDERDLALQLAVAHARPSALRYGHRYSSSSIWSAFTNAFVAIIIAPNAVTATICPGVSHPAMRAYKSYCM